MKRSLEARKSAATRRQPIITQTSVTFVEVVPLGDHLRADHSNVAGAEFVDQFLKLPVAVVSRSRREMQVSGMSLSTRLDLSVLRRRTGCMSRTAGQARGCDLVAGSMAGQRRRIL